MTEMKMFLDAWEAADELSDPSAVWEWMKFTIKGFVTDYQKKNKSASAQFIKDLRQELQELEKERIMITKTKGTTVQ